MKPRLDGVRSPCTSARHRWCSDKKSSCRGTTRFHGAHCREEAHALFCGMRMGARGVPMMMSMRVCEAHQVPMDVSGYPINVPRDYHGMDRTRRKNCSDECGSQEGEGIGNKSRNGMKERRL